MSPKATDKKTQEDAKLRAKQVAFVEQYLTCWNATEAAKRAGYSARSARSIGSENLTKPDIRAMIDKRLKDLGMGADEVLARLSDMASSTMADFIKPTKSGSATLDLVKAAKADKLHLIKKFRVGIEGVSIELYDSQAALVQLGRHHALFVDKQEHSGEIGVLTPEEIENRRRERWEKVKPALAAAMVSDGDETVDA